MGADWLGEQHRRSGPSPSVPRSSAPHARHPERRPALLRCDANRPGLVWVQAGRLAGRQIGLRRALFSPACGRGAQSTSCACRCACVQSRVCRQPWAMALRAATAASYSMYSACRRPAIHVARCARPQRLPGVCSRCPSRCQCQCARPSASGPPACLPALPCHHTRRCTSTRSSTRPATEHPVRGRVKAATGDDGDARRGGVSAGVDRKGTCHYTLLLAVSVWHARDGLACWKNAGQALRSRVRVSITSTYCHHRILL